VQRIVDLYTRDEVTVPSLTETVAPTRIVLTRAEHGKERAWLAEVEEIPGCTGQGSTPEEALRRAWSAADEASPEATPRHSGRLLVRMPATLHDELARAAAAEGVSLNQFITGILSSSVAWRATDTRPQLARDTGGRESGRTAGDRARSLLLVANVCMLFVASAIAVALLVTAWS
jgi:antitoxin HicB